MNTMNDRYKGRQTTVDPTITERLFINRPELRPSETLEGKISLFRVKDARK